MSPDHGKRLFQVVSDCPPDMWPTILMSSDAKVDYTFDQLRMLVAYENELHPIVPASTTPMSDLHPLP